MLKVVTFINIIFTSNNLPYLSNGFGHFNNLIFLDFISRLLNYSSFSFFRQIIIINLINKGFFPRLIKLISSGFRVSSSTSYKCIPDDDKMGRDSNSGGSDL